MLGHDLRRDRRAVRRSVGLLGHATGLYDDLTVADNVRFWARAARRSAADADAALARLGLDGRLAGVPWPASRPASAGGRRWPSWWPGPRASGCSTSPTPASTPTAATCSTASSARRCASAAPSSCVSHELERAASLAGRTVVAGRRPDHPAAGARHRAREAAGVA